MWWSVSSNWSTAPWGPREFFSSCSLHMQWSRYLYTFCFGVSVSVLILAMIQDQALVAAKQRTKHYLVETKEKSPGHKPSRGYNHSRGHGDYAGWAPWYQHISIFSTHQTGKHSHQSHQVSLVCLLLCMICLLQIQTENNTVLGKSGPTVRGPIVHL